MEEPPNIVVVTVDSLRADSVYESETDTPACGRLVDTGITFERAFSQGPFTTFSMPSLFTSRYPSGLQYLEFSDATVGVYIDEEPTLPEVLRENGYDTAGFHSNPLLSNLFGFDRGFDTFDAQLPFSGTERLPGRAKILADKLFRLARKHAYLPADRINDRAIGWLDDRSDDRPFFLWLHYMDVHGPYQSKSGNAYLNKYRGERLWRKAQNGELSESEHEELRETYQEEVEYTDDQFGHLLDALRRRGLFEDTLIVFTADHGEGFDEHGFYSHPHQLYDELTHVPLIVSPPGGSGGETVSHPVELIDVFPTVCSYAGVKAPDTLAGETLPDDENNTEASVISEADLTPAYHGSVRTDQWKYIDNRVSSESLLFDLTVDHEERQDLTEEYPEVRARLADRLANHLEEDCRTVGTEQNVVHQDIEDEEVQDRLEDLGYLE